MRLEVTTMIRTCWWHRSLAACFDLSEGRHPCWWCGRGLCAPSVPHQRPAWKDKIKAARLDVALKGRGQAICHCVRGHYVSKVNKTHQVPADPLRWVSNGWANIPDMVKFGSILWNSFKISSLWLCVKSSLVPAQSLNQPWDGSKFNKPGKKFTSAWLLKNNSWNSGHSCSCTGSTGLMFLFKTMKERHIFAEEIIQLYAKAVVLFELFMVIF